MDRHDQLGGDLIGLLRQFRGRRVLVVGDAGTDIWWDVEPRREFEPGRETWRVVSEAMTPAMARFVLSQCEAIGGSSYIHSSTATINFRFSGLGVQAAEHLDVTHGPPMRAIEQFNAIIISDYGKGTCTPDVCREVIDAANRHKIPVLVDPARGVDWERYRGATCIKCSDECDAPDSEFVPPYEVCTWGHEGLVLIDDKTSRQIPAYTPAAPFVDAIGCGDIVAAVLGLTLAVGADLLLGCRLAAVVAGMKTQYRGCRAITAAEIEAELSALAVGAEPVEIRNA